MKKFDSSNILVTGGTGFVGSHLVEELVKQNTNVITTFLTTDPQSYFYTRKLYKKVRMAHVDICDFDAVFDLITKCHIDYIFHLAAQPLVEVAYSNPRSTLQSNIMGTVNILESARLYPNVKGIIIASSDKAYGKMEAEKTHREWPAYKDSPGVERSEKPFSVEESDIKYKETDPLRGDHPYEVSKSSTDLIAYSYYKTYNLPIVITRFGNIYGEGDLNFSRIIPGIMKSLINNETLEIRSDGKYVRDYLYVKDVVRGYILLAENIDKVKGQAYNFGSDETLSVLDLIRLIEKTLNKKINYKILNTAKNEIPHQSLDYSKIKKILHWKPKADIKQSAKKILNWYKKNG